MRKKKRAHPWLKSSVWSFFVGFFLFCLLWFVDALVIVRLPQQGKPVEVYANQTRDDFRKTLMTAIDEAKHSILLIIYTLTDDNIIAILRKKAEEGVNVNVIVDAKASPFAAAKLGPQINTHRQLTSGLMHQKILVLDRSQVWIGSANMTPESLRIHGNLMTAVDCPELAEMIFSRAEGMYRWGKKKTVSHQEFTVAGQKMEFWFLPDDKKAVRRIIDLIETAKKTVRVAMFTWTRQDFAEAVIAAKQRNVEVQIVIDRNAGKGAGAKIVRLLQKNGVPVALSQGSALLHHKFLYIDGKTLVNGSANWTKAAFMKNDDCFLVLHELTESQQERLERVWRVIWVESMLWDHSIPL